MHLVGQCSSEGQGVCLPSVLGRTINAVEQDEQGSGAFCNLSGVQ
jgi:hypothetical protein